MQFWKQFFESSANVSLSGYEELPSTHDETTTEDSTATTHTTLETSQSYETPSAQHISTDSTQELDFSNLTISPTHSTPRPKKISQPKTEPTTSFADFSSPYEALRQEVNTAGDATKLSQVTAPETPEKPSAIANNSRDVAMTPQSSPYAPPTSIPQPSNTHRNMDPLLHRVLDRNYRVQATPMTNKKYKLPSQENAKRPQNEATPSTSRRTRLIDATLSSSPEMAAPELHAEVFSSPVRKPRTPGVSVLPPDKTKAKSKTPGIWDSDDDSNDEVYFQQSPPKTMQFHVPQSRLLQTPGIKKSCTTRTVTLTFSQ